jgi:acyl-CoA synthetase (AMP-forming)/AMP-acid ligase II
MAVVASGPSSSVRWVERHRVTFWAVLPAMLVDFFAQPGIEDRDLGSLSMVTGGGAATPQHVNDLLKSRYGLDHVEGYGLTESANFLCANPVHKPKKGCLGVPTFGVDLRIVDPQTLAEVGRGESGEIVVHAAQIMLGCWNHPARNAEAFIVLDGQRFSAPATWPAWTPRAMSSCSEVGFARLVRRGERDRRPARGGRER